MLSRAEAYAGRGGAISVLVDEPGILDIYRRQISNGVCGPWRHTGASFQAWSSWRSTVGGPTVHLGLLPYLDYGRTPLFSKGEPPEVISWRMGWYHAHIGPWLMTAGVSGVAAIRAQFTQRGKGQQPYWGVGSQRPIADEREMAGDIIWQRRPTTDEARRKYAHAFDLNAARLAAANVAYLPWDRLEHTGPQPFAEDESLTGYWQVRLDQLPRTSMYAPRLFNPNLGRQGVIWLTSPIVKEYVRAGINLDVVDSYTAQSKRWLLTWANKVQTARLRAMALGDWRIVRAVKSTYKETMGMLMRQGGSAFLPVVGHTVIDRQRATVLGHIRRVHNASQLWPMRVLTDAVWYASDEPDPVRFAEQIGISLGTDIGEYEQQKEIGRWKHHSTMPMSEFLKGAKR